MFPIFSMLYIFYSHIICTFPVLHALYIFLMLYVPVLFIICIFHTNFRIIYIMYYIYWAEGEDRSQIKLEGL